VAGRARKLIAVERRLVHGCVQVAEQIMLATQTQLGVINTAYIERLQATLRGWLPMAFRRTRCPARSADRVEDALFWTGVVYNLCAVHRMLDATPANLTDHVWTIDELLRFTPRRI